MASWQLCWYDENLHLWEFFSNAWNMSQPQSWYVLLPVWRHKYISDSIVSGLRMFHDVPTTMSYGSKEIAPYYVKCRGKD
jgi:hypothetical protein